MNDFWKETISAGYYDRILERGLTVGRGIQPNWHHSTFVYVKQFIKSEDKHLDYACGPGAFIGKYLYKNSIGVDISGKQIDYSINKYGDKGQFLRINDFNVKDYKDYFEKITIIGLFEFITDDQIIELLNKLHYILALGGKIYITTPNYRSLMSIFEILVNRFTSVDYKNQHINRFDKKRLMRLISQSKFDDVKVKKILNIGVFIGAISFNFSQKVQKFLYILNQNKFGYLLLGIVKK